MSCGMAFKVFFQVKFVVFLFHSPINILNYIMFFSITSFHSFYKSLSNFSSVSTFYYSTGNVIVKLTSIVFFGVSWRASTWRQESIWRRYWRQLTWCVRYDVFWRQRRFLTIFDNFWRFSIFSKNWKKLLTKNDKKWRYRQ